MIERFHHLKLLTPSYFKITAFQVKKMSWKISAKHISHGIIYHSICNEPKQLIFRYKFTASDPCKKQFLTAFRNQILYHHKILTGKS